MKKVIAILVAIGMVLSSGSFMSSSAVGGEFSTTPIDWSEAPEETLPIPVM